jgi:diguanylate cyclase (GGDEF)-like protein
MRLTNKIALIIGLPALVMVVVLGLVLNATIVGRFADLEVQQLERHHERLLLALDGELAELERVAVDWGAWDDAYRYMRGHNPAFLAATFTPTTFDNLQLDGVLLFDAQRRLRNDFTYDRASRAFAPLAPELQARIARLVAAGVPADRSRRGLVQLGPRVMQVGMSSMLDSNGGGEPAGTLVMLRSMDAERINRLAERTRLSVSFHRMAEPGREGRPVVSLDDDSAPRIADTGNSTLSAFSMLRDMRGEPALLMQVDMPRELLRQGRETLYSLLGIAAVSILLLGLGVFLAIRHVVVRRLSRIGRALVGIGSEGSTLVRLPVDGNDEIDRLTTSINAMLDGIERAYSARRQGAERQRELNALLVSIATDERLALGDEESLFRVLTGSLGHGVRLDRWSLWLHHPDAGPPTCWRISAGEELLRPPPTPMAVLEAMQEWSDEEGAAIPLPADEDDRHALLFPFAVDMWRGALVVESPEGAGAWAEDEVAFLLSATTLVQRSLDAHFLHVRERALRQQAEFDPLTGLANRAMFERAARVALSRCGNGHGSVALLFLDLDRFKPVNDTHGHAVGDWLLRRVAERIRETLRAQDLVARLGGDEFTVLLDALPDAAAERIAEKLVRTLAQPFFYNDIELEVGCSIGIAFVPPHRPDFESLLHAADMAMYEAKQHGRNTWRVGEPA